MTLGIRITNLLKRELFYNIVFIVVVLILLESFNPAEGETNAGRKKKGNGGASTSGNLGKTDMSGVASSLQNAKALLRKEMKKRIAALTKEEKQIQSDAVVMKLLSLPEYKQSSRVSVYLNMDDEIQTAKIVEDIVNSGKTCFIPRYNKDEMVMVRLHSMQDLRSLPKTKWNIAQPLETDQREDALETGGLDLVIVPGLAFTLKGGRMGRGKGYYDQFLTKCKAKSKALSMIAIAFKEQILPDLPMSEHDVTLDRVISPETK